MITDPSPLNAVLPVTAITSDWNIKKQGQVAKTANKHSDFNRKLQRYETKYVIPKEMVQEIRGLIRPFCEPDPHCTGDPPTYTVCIMPNCGTSWIGSSLG